MNAAEIVIQHLEDLAQRGEKTVMIDADARGILRHWMQEARAAKRAAASTPAFTPQDASPEPPAFEAEAVSPAELLQDPMEPSETADPVQEVFFRLPQGSPAEQWQHFQNMLPKWQPLQELDSLRDVFVFGEGRRDADIFFVSDAPGYADELEGRPLMGPAGDKFQGMLTAMGLSRDQVYLTHLVKKRPALARQTTNNRPPNEEEIRLSAAVLAKELELVQPKVIVALGVVAARGTLGMGALPLAEYQSAPRFHGNIPVVVTHHPSYLLRTSDRAERRSLWEDMLRCMEFAALPISPKQQGYFLPSREA